MTKPQHEPYRSKDEIISEILKAVKEYESRGGILRIKMLYVSRLSSWQLNRYLQELLENELLTIDKSQGRPVAPSPTDYRKRNVRRGDVYHITERGGKYLKMIQDMNQKMGVRI